MGSQLINQEFGILNEYLRKPASSLFSVPLPDKPGEVNQSTISREQVLDSVAKSKCGGTSWLGNNRNEEVLKLNILPTNEKVEGALPPSINKYFQNQGKRLLYKDLRQVRQRQDEKTRMVYDYFTNMAETTAKQRALSLYLAGMSVDEVAEQLRKSTSEVAQLVGSTSQNSVAQIQQLLYGDRGQPTAMEGATRGRMNAVSELQRLDGQPGTIQRGSGDVADVLKEQNTMQNVAGVGDDSEQVELNNPMMEEPELPGESRMVNEQFEIIPDEQPQQEQSNAFDDLSKIVMGEDEDIEEDDEDQIGAEGGGEIEREVQKAVTSKTTYDQLTSAFDGVQPSEPIQYKDPQLLNERQINELLNDYSTEKMLNDDLRPIDVINSKYPSVLNAQEKGFYAQTIEEMYRRNQVQKQDTRIMGKAIQTTQSMQRRMKKSKAL